MLFSDTNTHLFSSVHWRYLPFLLSCLFVICLSNPPPSPAQTDREAKKKQIEKGIKKHRININKLQGGIALQKGKIESSELQQKSLLEELAAIDARLLAQLKKLLHFEDQVARQEELIDKKELELYVFKTSKKSVQEHLQKRIKAYYKMGKIGVANVAFSTKSMPQMLQFRDSFSSLIAYDKVLVDEYRQSITTLQRAQTTLTLEKAVLDDFIAFAIKEQATTNTIKGEKEVLFKQIKNQKTLHQLAVKEMEKSAHSLSRSLKTLKKKDTLFDQGFLLEKGKHPAPIKGKVLTRFGEERKNRLGIKGKTTGITIATQGINKIHAVFEGEVNHAAYLYGYGNTIIIDHGHSYFSITSRLDKLLVKKGEKIVQGEIIALTGDTATLMEDGIYFEIRQDSKPLDPLQWLDKNSLTLP